MRPIQTALLIGALATAGGACASLRGQGQSAGQPLSVPPPPAHVVVPIAPVEAAPPTEPAAGTDTAAAPPAAPRVPRTTPPKPEKTDKVDKTDPPAPPAAAPAQPPPLQTTTNTAELEQKIRGLLNAAARDFGRINYSALSADRKDQYDAAKRFCQQAEDALKVKNLVFAEQLADKAATLAALLINK